MRAGCQHLVGKQFTLALARLLPYVWNSIGITLRLFWYHNWQENLAEEQTDNKEYCRHCWPNQVLWKTKEEDAQTESQKWSTCVRSGDICFCGVGCMYLEENHIYKDPRPNKTYFLLLKLSCSQKKNLFIVLRKTYKHTWI